MDGIGSADTTEDSREALLHKIAVLEARTQELETVCAQLRPTRTPYGDTRTAHDGDGADGGEETTLPHRDRQRLEQRAERAEDVRRASEEKFRVLFETIDQAVCVIDLLYDGEGKVVDLRYVDHNPALERMTGLRDIVGKLASEVVPNLEASWREAYGQVARTGEPLRIEDYQGDTDRWYLAYAARFGHEGTQVAVVFDDITERKRAEIALRESEEKYRTLFESMDEGFLVHDMIRDASGRVVDYRLVEANPAHQRATGLPPETIGKLGSEFMPDVEPSWLELFHRVSTTGVAERAEMYNAPTSRWYNVQVSPVRGHDRVAIVFDDVTARKQAELALRASEERQAFLLRFSDALRAEPSPDAVVDRAIRMLIEHLQLDRSYIVSYRLDEDRANLVHQIGNDRVPPLPDVFILSDYPAAFRATLDQTLVIEDEFERQGLSEAERRNSGRLGMRAMVAATLRKGANNPLWSMVAMSARPRCWTRGEVTLVEEVAERTWAAVQRARAEAALRESEERQAFLLRLADALRPLADPVAIQVEATRVLGQHLGASRAMYSEVEADDAHFVVHRDYTDGVPSLAGRHLLDDFGPEIIRDHRAGRTLIVTDVVGDERVGEARLAAYAALGIGAYVGVPLVKGGRLTASLSVHFPEPHAWSPAEVSLIEETAERTWAAVERAKAERAVRENEERNAFLVRFTDAVRGLSDPALVAEEACRLLTQQLGTRRTYWAVIDWATHEYVVEYVVVEGETSVEPTRWPLDPRDPFAAEHRAGRTVVYNDTESDSRIPDPAKAAMLERGMRSGISVPVVVGGTLRSVLNASLSTPHRWSPAEVAFVEALAGRAWAEIERARAEAALRESEEKYRTLFESMGEGFALCELVRDAAGRAVDYRYVELNSALVRHSKVTTQMLAGRRATEVFPELDPWLIETYAHVVDEGTSTTAEHYFPHVDQWLRINAFPRGGDRFAVLFSDVTEQRRAAAALKASEENFRSIANVVPDLLWYSEPDGSTTWYNERWMEYTGQAVDEAVGWGWVDAIHPDDREGSTRRYREAVDAGTSLQHEHRVRRHDGEYHWFLVRAQPSVDVNGRVIRMYGAATDIHEERTARDVLEAHVAERTFQLAGALEDVRSSEERLRLLLHQVPAMLWTTDRELHVTSLMGSDVPMSGWPGDGETVDQLFAEVDGNGTTTLHRQVLGGEPAKFEFHLDSHTYEAHLEPLRNADGGTIGTIGVAHDVTDRTLRRLQEDFIASVSHELQTPLTSVRASLGLLDAAVGDTLGTAERELLSASRRNAERLRLEIGQVLAANRLTTSGPQVERSVIDLHGLVDETVRSLQTLFLEKEQTITVDMADRLEVEGDRRLLEQVLANLLSNAYRHTPPGTAIAVSGWFVGNDVRLAVHDTGPGIPPDQLEAIFQRFYRSPGSRREGIGLGLAITRDAVEAQGGRVWAESVLGQGTTFFVSLPRARDSEPA